MATRRRRRRRDSDELVAVTVRLSSDELAAIDAYCDKTLTNRPNASRLLLHEAIARWAPTKPPDTRSNEKKAKRI